MIFFVTFILSRQKEEELDMYAQSRRDVVSRRDEMQAKKKLMQNLTAMIEETRRLLVSI